MKNRHGARPARFGLVCAVGFALGMGFQPASALAHSPPATAHLTTFQTKARNARAASPIAAQTAAVTAPVTVSRTAPGQTGYVHYFVITGPDGEPETQVGLELPGDRIAWSFPELGVSVYPFIASGQIVANGKTFDVEHLYGIRPFSDEGSMASLRRELDSRIAWWIDQKTPYCDEQEPSSRLCTSCLGFVMRVLYPGSSPAWVALPADFRSTRGSVYTTEDLLMYLAGVRPDATRQARTKRIQALKVPENLREELARISNDVVPEAAPTVAKTRATRPAAAKPRSMGRTLAAVPKRGMPRSGS